MLWNCKQISGVFFHCGLRQSKTLTTPLLLLVYTVFHKKETALFSTVLSQFLVDFYCAAALLAMQSAVIPTAITPVSLSVCPSVTRWYPIPTNEDKITRSSLWDSKNTPVCWYQQWLGATSASTKNLRSKWPTPSEKRWLRPISAYNVSTVRASEKSSIIANRKSVTCFPTSYRRSAYVVPKSPRGDSKSKFVIFVNKNQFKSNKLCYKVSLCENF